MIESEKRHLNVILEEMNGKLNLVLEGHEALDGKMAAGFKHLGDKVEGHEDRIRFLERDVA